MTNNKTPGQKLGRLSNKIRRRLTNMGVPCSCSGAQEKVLHFLICNSERDIFQKDVENEFGMRAATASELMKGMEQRQFIVRVPVETDGRKKKIVLTEKSLMHKEKVQADMDEFEGALIKGITQEDMEVFNRVIDKMIDNMN